MKNLRERVRVMDKWWEDHQDMYFSEFKKIMMLIPEIKKVIYDIPNNTTIVYFADGTKEISRVMEGDTFDKEIGVLQCIVKKMYGSRSKWLKNVVNKGIEVKPKKDIKRDVFDELTNGKIEVELINGNIVVAYGDGKKKILI